MLSTCLRHAHASLRPGLQPDLQLAIIMECSLYLQPSYKVVQTTKRVSRNTFCYVDTQTDTLRIKMNKRLNHIWLRWAFPSQQPTTDVTSALQHTATWQLSLSRTATGRHADCQTLYCRTWLEVATDKISGWKIVQFNAKISQGSASTLFEERWQVQVQLSLRFSVECSSERTIKLGTHLPTCR